jgi:hypothetical protein
MPIERIISGGQTGADQGALAASKSLRIPTGGWAPRGFLTELGPSPWLAKEYGLKECPLGLTTEEVYRERTRANLLDCNAVLVLGDDRSAGSRLVRRLLESIPRESWWVAFPGEFACHALAQAIAHLGPRALMIAGNRQSHQPPMGPRGNQAEAHDFCLRLFTLLDEKGCILRHPAQASLFPAASAPTRHLDPEAHVGRTRRKSR